MKFDAYDLSGKVALVTGGAGLLGVQHASALIEKGATVYVSDINHDAVEKACLELGENAKPLYMNVADADNIESSLKQILDTEGAIHILINNAAIDPKVDANSIVETSRLENFPLEQWQFQIDVGLTGAFLCSKLFGSWMAGNGGGVILNIASDLSVFSPDQRLYRKKGLPEERQPVKPVTYPVIKTALIGLTRYLATYWADKNVRVNALSPGGVYTNQSVEFVCKLTELIPLGRMANADEYCAAVQFLCSEASAYMTGQNIVMDGGRSVL